MRSKQLKMSSYIAAWVNLLGHAGPNHEVNLTAIGRAFGGKSILTRSRVDKLITMGLLKRIAHNSYRVMT
jgi:hypothetical protein